LKDPPEARIRVLRLWVDGSRASEYIKPLQSSLENSMAGIPVIAEGNMWESAREESLEETAAMIAGGRVFDLYKQLPAGGNKPMRGEVNYEVHRLQGKVTSSGILYDGFYLSTIFAGALSLEAGALDEICLVLTDRLIGSFDRSDRRYHARVVIFGYPHVISCTGVVEAPARPREYYLIRQRSPTGAPVRTEIEESLEGRYIDYGDPRISEVLNGYALQCLFYQATGEPFCPKKECRLYNAHWQEEMINAQLGGPGELCETHSAVLAMICGGEEKDN